MYNFYRACTTGVAITRTNAVRGVTMVIFKMAFSGRSLDRCSSYNQILFAL